MATEVLQKKKRGNPNWYKGMVTPNPGGKPKGVAEVRAMIEKRTKNYPLLIASLLRIALNDQRGPDQISAAKLLLAYGLGKPQERVEHSGTVTLEELVARAGAKT